MTVLQSMTILQSMPMRTAIIMRRFVTKPLRSASMVLCAAAFIAAPVAGAQAQEGAFFKDILGSMGIIEKDREPIVYRERPGIVVPPKLDLPAPLAEPVQRNAAWPTDPDVAAKARKAREAREPRRLPSDTNGVSQGARLSVDQLRAGFRPGRGVPVVAEGEDVTQSKTGRIDARTLRNTGVKIESESVLAYGQEPPRQYLTDPPVGLRVPSRAAPLPKRLTGEPLSNTQDESNAIGFATGKY